MVEELEADRFKPTRLFLVDDFDFKEEELPPQAGLFVDLLGCVERLRRCCCVRKFVVDDVYGS